MEFYALSERCFTKKFQGYNYEICLFKNSKQDHTSLGSWDKATWSSNNFHSGTTPLRAKFTNGYT